MDGSGHCRRAQRCCRRLSVVAVHASSQLWESGFELVAMCSCEE